MKPKQIIIFAILWVILSLSVIPISIINKHTTKEKYKKYYKYDLQYDSLERVYTHFEKKYFNSKSLDSMLIYKDSCLNILDNQRVILDKMKIELNKK